MDQAHDIVYCIPRLTVQVHNVVFSIPCLMSQVHDVVYSIPYLMSQVHDVIYSVSCLMAQVHDVVYNTKYSTKIFLYFYIRSQDFIFTTPDTYGSHFISIVVLGTDTSDITFDGSLLSLTWTTVTATNEVYSHATMPIAEGQHLVSTSHFIMIYLYGHMNTVNYFGLSYGYPVVVHG